LRHQALGCGDVGAAFQQSRGNAKRNGRRWSFQGLNGDRKGRSGLANQQRDGMFILRTQNAELRV